MLKTWTLPRVGAAVLGALLCSVAASPVLAQEDSEKPVPDMYGTPYCVAGIAKDPNFINLMDPDRELSIAAVSFAYKTLPNAKVGDLITVKPGAKTADGQPEFTVVKAQDPKCKKFVGE
ncbi:MAG: hypothetical protein FJ148_24800 [Deltaproteobacteria bacterium]|nr:hypothetical protein [Deltaproteobacteria bacterium]